MQFRPKPAWFARLGIPWDAWVTIYPTIYHPAHVNPAHMPCIVEHEKAHICQQRSRLRFWCYWYPRYLFSRKFRLQEEGEAFFHEIVAHSAEDQEWVHDNACDALMYFYRPLWFSRSPARTREEAELAIKWVRR